MMTNEHKKFPDSATCIDESNYPNALTYGKIYQVIAWDEEKHQIKIESDNKKKRWYHRGYFDFTGKTVPTLKKILQYDSLEDINDWIEVTIELSDGQLRWCIFITPELLKKQEKTAFSKSEALLHYDNPHIIIVSVLSKKVIELSLNYIEAHGSLLASTKSLE
ncbi:hypothetical protein KDW_40560 [Dictyobacter vulcani]|uniref:Uncharacterized protein n=2 Tax=Dictyobacter vulcani TaxID=2607529 RepID=A0A5J4KK74_9CHLR|nr:hypothetical protein KDW_40560 [Dictyobacter vulcani]